MCTRGGDGAIARLGGAISSVVALMVLVGCGSVTARGGGEGGGGAGGRAAGGAAGGSATGGSAAGGSATGGSAAGGSAAGGSAAGGGGGLGGANAGGAGGIAGKGAGGVTEGSGGGGAGRAGGGMGGAGAGGAAGNGTGGAAPACDLAQPFGAPVMAPGLNSAADDYAVSVSGDGLSAIVASNRTDFGGAGNYDLYQATRTSATAAFGSFVLMPNLNSSGADTKPALTPDGLQLFFSSDRPGAGTGYDIYLATRPNLQAAFGATALVTAVSSTVADLVGSVTPDGRQLYFDRTTAANGRDIYVQDLASIQPPTLVSELNSKYDEGHAVLSGDLLTVYWASTRASLTSDDGSQEANVLVAHRTTPTGPFSGLAAVTELNTTSAEFPTYLSPDGCTIYIDSNRSGRQHLWVASKPASGTARH